MGTNAFLPSGEATTSWPVTPPSTMVATCRPLLGSTRLRVWSPLLATSSKPADEDEGAAESGVKNPAKMNVMARNQVIVTPLGLSRAILSHFWVGTIPANVQRGLLSSPTHPQHRLYFLPEPRGHGSFRPMIHRVF